MGAIIFEVFEHIVSAASPFHWMTLVGLLLILIVVFAPRGLVSTVHPLKLRLKWRRGE